MPAEKGIFLDVLPRFDMAAMGAILSKVEGMFSKSGAAMGSTFGKEAEARIAALAEAERKSANVTEDAELRKTRAIHATEIAETQAALATDRRVLAETRYQQLAVSTVATENSIAAAKLRVEAATIAETRASYAASDAALAETARTRDLATATNLSAAAHDRHAEAVAASAVTAGNAGRVFNVAGLAITGTFLFAMAESTKKASEFQSAMVKLTSAGGESQANIKAVSDGILQLAGQVGISSNQLADSMFLVEKAGYRGGDGLKVLTAASQLANAEGADLHDTVNGLTTTMRDFGFGVDQAATVASKMNVAAGDSKAPLQEFSGALHNVEPVAAIAKVRIDEVYAAMARITQSGAGADQASQWLNNTITHLTNMNDQQKKFLEGLKLDSVGLQQDLANPKIGMTGVIQEITDKIKGSLNPAGQVMLDTQFQSVNAIKALNEEYAHLTPRAKELADQIKAGTLKVSDLKNMRLDKEIEPMLRQWDSLYQKVGGFNDQLKKGQGDLMTVAAAFAKAFGTDSGLKVASLLGGTPEQAKAMSDELQKLKTTTAEADGTVKGFNETQETLAKKLDDAKAGFGAAAIQVGNNFIPAMTWVANVMKDVAQYFAHDKILLDGLMAALGLATTAWLGLKAVAVGSAMADSLGAVITKLGLVKIAAMETSGAMATVGTAAAVDEAEVATASAAEVVSVRAVGAAALTASASVLAIGIAAKEAMDYANEHKDDPDAIDLAQGNKSHVPGWVHDVTLGIPIIGSWLNMHLPGEGTSPTAGNDGKGLGAANPERRIGMPHPAGNETPPSDPLAALNALGTPGDDVQTQLDLANGAAAGGDAGASAPAAPVGTQNDPIYIDPQSVTDGLNDSDMGAQGTVGSGITDIFTNAGSGGFTLPNIAKLMGTFVANLALGNPAGKLATGQFGGEGDGDLSGDISRIENMTPTERIEQENTIKMQKGLRAYKKALRAYAKAVQKYGPGSDQALDAEDSVLNARDSIDQTSINQQQAGGTAAQAYANDLANGTATKNPGKFAKDQAAAGAYSGSVPAGAGAEGWRGTVAATVDKYAAQMGIPADKKSQWVDAIVSQIGTESQGNPGADNPHDSNGQGGTQHVSGLLQYLPSSYANSGGKLTGLPYMDPVGQIAGALFAPRNADGSPSGIGHGVGWGPQSRDVLPAAPAAPAAPSGPTAGDRAAANAPTSLSDVLFGGGQGPIFKRDKQPPVDPNAGNPNKGQTAASIAAENSPEALANLARMRSDPHWAPGQALPPGASPGTSPFAPGGALSALPPTPGGRLQVGPPSGGETPAPGNIGPFPVPQSVVPAVGHGAGVPGLVPSHAVNGVNPGAAPVGQPASQGVQSSQPKGGSGQGGVGLSQGLMSMASTALSAMPGGQAAAIGLQEANRAAQYIGQAIGIGASGLLETFTLHGANGAGGSGGWFGKVASGLAGAHKTSDNTAGAAKGLDPKAKESAPPLNPGEQPPPGGPKQGDPNSPGPGNGNNTINIQEQHIHHDDGGAQNRDAMRQLVAFQN